MKFIKNNNTNGSVKVHKRISITFFTRSMNDDLFQRCSSLVPNEFEHKQIKDEKAFDYFLAIMRRCNTTWAVNIDEDAYISDFNELLNLIEFLDDEGYDFAGVPDGGVCHRRFNPLIHNAFFNILNIKSIKESFGRVRKSKFVGRYSDEWKEIYEKFIPFKHKKLRYLKNKEPYYKFFWSLYSNDLKPYFMNAYEPGQINQQEDIDTTVVLSHREKPFLYHAWYARLFSSEYEKHVLRYQNLWKHLGIS